MRRAGPARLLRAACLAWLAAAALANHTLLVYNAPVPSVVRVCVMMYYPFVLERVRRAAPGVQPQWGPRARVTNAR